MNPMASGWLTSFSFVVHHFFTFSTSPSALFLGHPLSGPGVMFVDRSYQCPKHPPGGQVGPGLTHLVKETQWIPFSSLLKVGFSPSLQLGYFLHHSGRQAGFMLYFLSWNQLQQGFVKVSC